MLIFVRKYKTGRFIRTLGRIVRWFLGIIISLYLGIIILLNIPAIQQKTTVLVTHELRKILGTELSIGKISAGALNRIIIDDLLLNDQTGKEMLKVTRLSAKFEILPLFKGKIAISSVQLFGFNINLSKQNPEAVPNFQFVLNAFASKDSINEKSNLDLRINSILIRRGKLSYNVLSEPDTPNKFNGKHINLQNIIANISLKALSNDSINASIKRLSLNEQSGLELHKLSLKVLGNRELLQLENFSIALPNTSFNMDTVSIKYNGFEAFKHLADSVHFSGKMKPSYVTLKDISCFVPPLANFQDKLDLDLAFNGTINQLECTKLEINANEDIQIKGNVAFQDLSQGSDAYIYGTLSKLHIKRSGTDLLIKNLSKNNAQVPDILKRIGEISFRGEISGYFNDLVTYGVLNTELGAIKTDIKLSSDKDKAIYSSSGSVKTVDFKLGKLLAKENILGEISFNVDVSTVKYGNQLPTINLKGLISSIEYSKYEYHNIELDGKYEHGGFDGKIALNDVNGSILLNGNFNTAQKIPTFNFHADIRNVRPHDLNLLKKYEDSEFSLKLDANFEGNSIDNIIGKINVDSILFTAPEKTFFLDNINITATQENNEKKLSFTSQYITATVKGNYSYHTIPASAIKTVERYIPSLLSINKEINEPNNNFNFDINIYNTEELTEIFNLPVTIYTHSTIKGYFNDIVRKLRIEGYFPALRYGNHLIESGMILCENPTDRFKCQVRGSKRMKEDGALSFSVEAQARNDKMTTSINWGNNSATTYGGRLTAMTDFFKTEGEKPILQANIWIEPTEIILNDSIWNIHPSHIAVDSGRIFVDNFLFKHKDQYLRINGKLTKNQEDTVKVELNDINIGYVFDIVQLKDVDFTGMATGIATASQVMKSPELNAELFVKNFSFNNGLLGDMNISGKWDKEQEGIFLDARMHEKDISRTNVKGHIYPGKKGLDLNIDVDSTNIQFLQFYMRNIASDVHGRIKGHAHFFGGFKSLQLEGDVFANASLKFDILNTSFNIRDSIHLRPQEIQFKDCALYDPEGHAGKINGYLRHTHFKNLSYRFLIDVNNMLVYNTKEDPDMPFYGTVYGTGNASLNGGATGLNVDVAMSTNRNTNFVYMMNSTASAANNQFINFIDRTPKREIRDSIYTPGSFLRENLKEDNTPIDIHLNLQVDATPDGNMKIIMDPVAGDYISGKGNGNIRVSFFNKGDVKIFGNYTIDQGIYKFSLQEVIRKDFIIQSGSTIDFNGSPLDANLDIQAAYTVNSASLSDLGIGETFSQNNVKVNCMMNLTGNLTHPDIKFDIELPNVSEEEREIVRSAISTDEEMNMQILYLLGIGKFYTYDYGNNRSGQSSKAMSSMLSSTLSGQLNNMLSQALNLNNWNFGTNLSTGEKGWTDMEIEGILSGQLLNNRLLINGNFGYRDNPMANSNFVGDFDVEWLLTKSGEIRLKAYNQTNDRYYTKTTLTTQGVGIAYKKDFNTWRDIFLWNSRKRRKEVQPGDTIKTDSIGKNISVPESKKKRERK